MKKITSMMVAALLCMGLSVTAFAKGMDNFEAAKEYTGFSDVAEAAWYHGSVKAAFEYGLIKGASPTEFKPDGTLTVAEAIVMADRIHMLYATGEDTLVNGTPWYQTYVDYAIENDNIEDGDFADYNRNITRGEMADIFTRALPEEEYVIINDIPEELPLDIVGHKYEDSIRTLFRAGIVTGNDPYGTYTPDASIKRCEAAAIISRIVDESLRKQIALLTDWDVDGNVTVAAPFNSLSSYFELDEQNIDLGLQLTPEKTSDNGAAVVYKWEYDKPAALIITADEYKANLAQTMNVDPSIVNVTEVTFGSAKAYRYDVRVKTEGVLIRFAGYRVVTGNNQYEISEFVTYSGNEEYNIKADQILRDMVNNVKIHGVGPSSKLS
ncbi:MAG: S-layer homology domain-containing protein [Clostridia bacterium]|nr:S-layer homology domain-containing protein [Clostridia bacterium]